MKPTAVDPFHDVASSPRRWTRRAGPLGNQRSKVVEENPSESFFLFDGYGSNISKQWKSYIG